MTHIQRPINGLLAPRLAARRVRLASVSSCRVQNQRRALSFYESVSPLIESAANSFTWIHNAGVPWYMTIPLVAMGINLTIRFPLQVYMQKLLRDRNAIKPLIVAWSTRHAGKPFTGTRAEHTMRTVKMSEQSRKRIYRDWGVSSWKFMLPMSSMFPFVIVSEALRRLSGASRHTTYMESEVAEAIGPDLAPGLASIVPDMSLQTGGALWFPDLMAADPTLGLPLICSVLLAGNIFSRRSLQDWRQALTHHDPFEGPAQKFLRGLLRISIFVPLMPLAFSNMPAAVFLYWAANFACQLINVNVVQKIVPEREKLLSWRPIQPKLIAYVSRHNARAFQKKQK